MGSESLIKSFRWVSEIFKASIKMWLLIVLAVLDCFDGHVIAFMDHKYTNTWAVQINADVNEAMRMAEKYGFTYKMKISVNYYLFEHKSLPKISSKPSSFVEDGLIQEPLITWFAQQVKQRKVLYDHHVPISFNDPRWSDQVWYLNSPDSKGMNIDKVWQQGITGKGIVVAVVDDGLEQSHPDLRDNYDPTASLDLLDLDDTPDPEGSNSGHGNRCGGVIAASANNSECGVGVAFNANLGGIRLFEDDDDDTTDAMEALAFEHNRQHIDIYSCSWGPEDSGWTMGGPGKLANEQLQEGAKTGRQGKGSIFVFAAGNGGWNYDNCAYNGYANSVFTIAISGVSRNGSIPGYAERCSAVMACTYSQDNVRGLDAIITSNLNGTCTSTFSQTSAATAMASGIIALTLEANPSLTWRDVQHLIAYSSNSDVPRSGDWIKNAAGMWVSSYVGFGLMDAAVMVNYSRAWHTVPEQVKCEIAKPTGYRFFRQHLEVNVTVSNDNCGQESSVRYLEHVVVILEANFARRGYLEAFLTSPSGTTSHILPYRANDVLASNLNGWPILSLQFWGEDPQGTWRLRLQSQYPYRGFSGRLWKWTLALYGTATDPLQHNPHVPRSVTNRTTPRVSTGTVTDDVTTAPVDPAASHHKRLTQTAIAVISSTVFFVLVVISGVVLFKAGFFSRERKRITNTKLTTEINLSDQTVPLQDGDSVWIESSL